MQLLLAEDEQKTIDYLTKGLREEGHTVDAVDNGLSPWSASRN
nr:hypothetical protein [uncultured Acidocella sp.]